MNKYESIAYAAATVAYIALIGYLMTHGSRAWFLALFLWHWHWERKWDAEHPSTTTD